MLVFVFAQHDMCGASNNIINNAGSAIAIGIHNSCMDCSFRIRTKKWLWRELQPLFETISETL